MNKKKNSENIVTYIYKESTQRIDNFIFKIYKILPKNMIYRCLRIGKIKVNKKKVLPNYKLKLNDKISFFSINIPTVKKKIFF